MRACGAEGLRLRPRGGGTKLGWGSPVPDPDVEVVTTRLDRIVEHNAADLTAVLEAGVPLARAQEAFAEAGQMLALDPPLAGPLGAATVGGVIAAGDSGPLRHRYGAARDLLLGMTVALSDGTLARSGGRVIKNVAGYDLPKLFAGSFGTLGLIVEVVVRLHPRPASTATAVGGSDDPEALGRAAVSVARAPLQLEHLDVVWGAGSGKVVAGAGGGAPEERARAAARLMHEAGCEAGVEEHDEARWQRHRAAQRPASGASVKVSGLAAELPRVLRAAALAGGSLVGRAGLGLSWITLPGDELVTRIEELRRSLAPFACTLLDAPPEVREKVEVWGEPGSAHALMRRVKERFDPRGVCNPGIFVGGI